MVNGVGVPAFLKGADIHLGGGKHLTVEDACSGLKSLISLLAFATLFTYICKLRGYKRVLLLLSAVPIAVASNVVRIVVLTLVASEYDVALATPGGPGQTVTLAQVIDALVRLGLPPREAVGQARWAVDRARQPVIERSAPQALLDALHAAGLPVAVEPSGSSFFGSVACVELLESGTLLGAGDHRRETDLFGR